jgi:type IV pilus assembly protein PilN
MTIRINLLPHREARRERQKKAFYALTIGSVLAGGLLVLLVWSILQAMIGNQQERNAFIAAENAKLDRQIKEIATLREEIEALRARQLAVENLQVDRNRPVDLFNELVRQVPDGILLRAIKQQGDRVNVSGQAASNERVSELLRNLQDNSKYLDRPELVEIKLGAATPNQSRRLFDFSLNFHLKPTPERIELEKAQGAAAAPRPAAAPQKK